MNRLFFVSQEFARAIEGFEERLVSVENNVHKEISAVKSVAETLLQSSPMKNQPNGQKEVSSVEKRVVNLEGCMEKILDRLDNIASNVSASSKQRE